MGVVLRFVMWFVMLIGGSILGIIIDLRFFPGLFRNLYFHIATVVPGLILLRLVMLVSKNTGRFLARNGREGNIPRMETNKLVTTGMYGCMRHPMHLGLLFFPLSFALIVGSVSFLIIIVPVEMIMMLVLIKLVEEREAISKFGDSYREYMKEVPMFSFSPRCLRMLLVGDL